MKKRPKPGTKKLPLDSARFNHKMQKDRIFHLLRQLPYKQHEELIFLVSDYIRQVENDPIYRVSHP